MTKSAEVTKDAERWTGMTDEQRLAGAIRLINEQARVIALMPRLIWGGIAALTAVGAAVVAISSHDTASLRTSQRAFCVQGQLNLADSINESRIVATGDLVVAGDPSQSQRTRTGRGLEAARLDALASDWEQRYDSRYLRLLTSPLDRARAAQSRVRCS